MTVDNKIIIISGCPAAGKSTFSHQLARHLAVPCFNKDAIKETMGDGYGPESGDLDIISERYFYRDEARHWVHIKAESKTAMKEYALRHNITEVSFGGEVIFVDATCFDKIDYNTLYALAERFLGAH
jgi:tRNA uridine 5-carbamoylmethylation protein Kti12